MAALIEYNKVAMQNLRKQLRARQLALPTLKNKESVLRSVIQRTKTEVATLEAAYREHLDRITHDIQLWAEFPYGIFSIKAIETRIVKLAGVSVPKLEAVDWEIREFSKFNKPIWVTTGVLVLKELAYELARIQILKKTLEILEHARRKTTQKVNLYEKVQIPSYSQAILAIKRYLEDVENLEKASQKLVKQRLIDAEAASDSDGSASPDGSTGPATPDGPAPSSGPGGPAVPGGPNPQGGPTSPTTTATPGGPAPSSGPGGPAVPGGPNPQGRPRSPVNPAGPAVTGLASPTSPTTPAVPGGTGEGGTP